MSRHKCSSSRKRRKSKKCLEPLNTMIDLAGGLAMAVIAGSMEKKHRYKERGKINPYEVSALGIATGRMKNTKDFIRAGAVLGALGSFDDDNGIVDDELFPTEPFMKKNDNWYAWRLNCEDGSAYGIFPENYETREEYNKALHNEKYGWRDYCEEGWEYDLDPEDFETEEEYEEALEEARGCVEYEYDDIDEATNDEMIIEVDGVEYKAGENIIIHVEDEADSQMDVDSSTVETQGILTSDDPFADDDFHVYVYCLVKLQAIDAPIFYRTEDRSLRKGGKVIVLSPDGRENVIGEIISIEHHMRFSVPVPVENTQVIISNERDS